ncbi:MAG: hypothetical protein CBD27_06495 [Rhodospirillaceae bacterium TMED167]|nr:hypothetical protein [Rhodospirillaceae bacterium]OUW27309.1 MAG: hypothetical protein CBD27_06495 [Rhodospirillaceae bacterium TMED167]
MTIGRLCGWILLVTAFLFAAADVAAQGLIGQFGVLSTVDVLDVLAPDFLDRIILVVRDGIHPLAWDPVLINIMMLPGWLLAGAPGVALVWWFRMRPIGGDEENLPYSAYEVVAAAAAEESKLHSRKPSKYENFQEYDPTNVSVDPEDLMVFNALAQSGDSADNLSTDDEAAWPMVVDGQIGSSFDQNFEVLPVELGERDAVNGKSQDATAHETAGKLPGSGYRPANENEIPDETDPWP